MVFVALDPSDYSRNKLDKIYQYGTAGFRTRDDELPPVMYRMGIVAALRSKAKSGQSIGVMITASHNPEGENGVKLIDPKGDMLDSRWESYATQLANAVDTSISEEINSIMEQENLRDTSESVTSNVFCARDTRPSGAKLLEAVKAGVHVIKPANFVSYGILTTPQLHYIVKCQNSSADGNDDSSYGDPSETGYYVKYSSAFRNINRKILQTTTANAASARYDSNIFIDAANGVGGPNFVKMLGHFETGLLNVTIVNNGQGPLNDKCGADFVKVERKAPKIYNADVQIRPVQKWVSFDGDADRLVYFFEDQNGQLHLLDGDKIAVLLTSFLCELLTKAKLSAVLKLGIVQTAYANGSSTSYIEKNFKGVNIYCVPTGVKHLHKQAEKLDIGVYFEANGHGTILFSKKFKTLLNDQKSQNQSKGDDEESHFIELLSLFVDLINESIGDAMADLLAVETVLRYKNWSVQDWDDVYSDFPSKQLKVKVLDRNIIKTTDAERRCVEPVGLQEAIDSTVVKYKNARAFVRPSGTEDIVRIYAEADTEENVGKLASEIAIHVRSFAKGID